MSPAMVMKSPNQVPLHTDWERYETPAVVRKHGRQFLERLWIQMEGDVCPSGIERIARHYGARLDESNDEILLFFDDADRAAACAKRLRESGAVASIVTRLAIPRQRCCGVPEAAVGAGREA